MGAAGCRERMDVPLHGVGGCCNKGKRRNRDEKN
jgi:hypothetical protein